MDKKLLICDTAIKVMAREGYYNTKVQMVADESKIAVGTIYLYFQGKEEILDYIFKEEFDERIRFLEELEKRDEPVLSKIKAFLEFHLNGFIEKPDRIRVIAQEIALFSKHMNESTKELLIKLRQGFGKLIEEGQKSGEIRDMDTYSAAIFIFHSIRSVVYTKQFEERNEEYEKLKEEIIKFILNGLKK